MRSPLFAHKLRYQFYFDTATLLSVLHLLEASTAVDRSVVRRLENNLRNAAALSTRGLEVFTRSSSCVLLCITASLAALGLVLEALFLVESLLACSEHEFVSALLANQSFVDKLVFSEFSDSYFFVHDFTSLCKMVLYLIGFPNHSTI